MTAFWPDFIAEEFRRLLGKQGTRTLYIVLGKSVGEEGVLREIQGAPLEEFLSTFPASTNPEDCVDK